MICENENEFNSYGYDVPNEGIAKGWALNVRMAIQIELRYVWHRISENVDIWLDLSVQ